MYFFYETQRTITQSTPLGNWNLGGYREVAIHMWVKGPGGAKVFPEIYFNNLSAAQETLTIGPAGPGGWNIALLAKVYPVFAPTLSVVLYNPTAQMDFKMRLYAACWAALEQKPVLTRSKRGTAAVGEPERVLREAVDMEALIPAPKRG